jgi:predicted AlkP superfamily phosphohydrolase/phosphomutase
MFLPENDTGPDDAVHAHEGIYILRDPKNAKTEWRDANILDIAPTVLDRLGIPVPADMKGKIL